MRRLIAILIASLAFGALSGVAAYQKVRSQGGAGDANWQEIAWPFPRDAWPAGRAFRCRTASMRRGRRALRAAEDRLLQLRYRGCRRR